MQEISGYIFISNEVKFSIMNINSCYLNLKYIQCGEEYGKHLTY